MSQKRDFQVVLLPAMEVAAEGLSLREAEAWIRAYNAIVDGRPQRAVIAEPAPARRAA